MAEISIKTKERNEMLDITDLVAAQIPVSLESGVCFIFCDHTTAGLTVNENADPDVKHDLLSKLASLCPEAEPYYMHEEGNSAAHLKASLMGFSLTLPVINGRLVLGAWQGIYLCEFDGPRRRKISVMWQRAENCVSV